MNYHRWNFDADDTHVLVCKHEHEKYTPCRYEELHPAEVLKIINELRSEVIKQRVMTQKEYDVMVKSDIEALRDQFAMNAPIKFSDAVMQCGYCTPLTETERSAVMSVLALMRYEYADAMIKQKEVVK